MDVQNVIDSMSKIVATINPDGSVDESNLKSVQDIDRLFGCLSTSESKSVRFTCITRTTELLFRLKNTDDLILNIGQTAIVSKCIDCIVKFGFIPCLIPSVMKSFENKQTNIFQSVNDDSINTKYEELKFIANSFLDLIKEPTLKRLIMTKHTNILLAGLCQLSLLPIAKPDTEMALKSSIDEFKYEQLKNEQRAFKNVLDELILTNRDPLVIREIIFTLGRKNCQKHLKRGLKKMFSDLLTQSNGIQTFLRVACDLNSETSQNFYQHGLEEWSNLIHSYYVKSKTKYIEFVIPQIWELLRSNSKFHKLKFQSISVYCMYLMSIENYTDFLEFYVSPVDQAIKKCKCKTNKNVSQSIEDLHTLYYLFRNEIWSLNPKLLTHVAMTIYNIYVSTASSVYYLKSKLEDLVFLILVHFSKSKDHLKQIIFSQYEIVVKFIDESADIQIECVKRTHQLELENHTELILSLIDKRKHLELMKTIFITMLEMYADISSNEYSVMEKFFITRCIQHLIEKEDVRKSLSSDPEIILNLIKSILKEIVDNNVMYTELLSVILMILGCVIENIDGKYFNQLDCLIKYMDIIVETVKDEDVCRELILEMKRKIKHIQNTDAKVSADNIRTIDDILYETRDPLLPVRAHALMELKKKIESGDEKVLTNKLSILIVIQENLKDADSYLYLSAIYTLSALCAHFPDDILPILCEEYSLPKNYNHSPETRLKIGEVLMKTVKVLNKTIPVHKNRLLNALLAGVRDEDHLVRMSSLSNLGDVCYLLHYSLGPIVAEIVNCASYVLKHDPDVECHRSAVFLLQNIINGADSELIEILADSIKEIYRILTFQYQCSKDDTVKLHSQIAIERLNDIMKSLFLNDQNRHAALMH